MSTEPNPAPEPDPDDSPTLPMSLADHERCAQAALFMIAREARVIRNDQLWPDAPSERAWMTYCRERFGLSREDVARIIVELEAHERMTGTTRRTP